MIYSWMRHWIPRTASHETIRVDTERDRGKSWIYGIGDQPIDLVTNESIQFMLDRKWRIKPKDSFPAVTLDCEIGHLVCTSEIIWKRLEEFWKESHLEMSNFLTKRKKWTKQNLNSLYPWLVMHKKTSRFRRLAYFVINIHSILKSRSLSFRTLYLTVKAPFRLSLWFYGPGDPVLCLAGVHLRTSPEKA